MGASSHRKRLTRRKRSVVGLLALVASAIFLLPASQASAEATQSNACVNNLIANQSSSIPITMGASLPASVEAGTNFELTEIKQKLEVPPAVFLSGYNLGLLTEGLNEVPTKVKTVIAATNTTVATQETNQVSTVAKTTIFDPDHNHETITPGTTATPGEVNATYANETWKASAAGAVNFREATVIDPGVADPPGFSTLLAGVKIEALVGGGVITAKFGCDPGTVVEQADPTTIVRTGTAATFASTNAVAPKPKFALNLTKSGTGNGTFQCNGVACEAEYVEGTKVTVTASPNAGSHLVAFSGDCTGATCEVEMSAAKTVNAQFDLNSESLTTTKSGSGEVACEVNGSAAPCTGSYPFGSTVKVVATPAAENNLGSLTGTGSAAGKCSVLSKECNFTLNSASTVAAVFEAAGTKAVVEGNVHGEVPQTTSIESGCSDVNLGKFIPGAAGKGEFPPLVAGHSYENSCLVSVTSTGEATSLTAADLSGIDTGRLTQKPLHPYSLPLPLFVGAQDVGGLGGVATIGGALVAPVKLMSWAVPMSKDVVGIGFRQPIGEHDPLHTGVYAKTITLTLQQTTP